MEETENIDVQAQEVVEPENTESSEAQPAVAENSEVKSADTKEYNWRQMEEKVKQEKQEKEQLQRRIWELEQATKTNTATKDEKDELAQLQEDDLITYGQLDKLAEKKARAIFQEELKKAEKAKQPILVKQKFPDFEKIVTPENIEKLKKEDPELERLILLSENPYERTYKEIKRSDFYRSSENNKESQEKIAENSKKPVSSNTFGKQRPLSYANDYAKGDASLFDEMQKYRGGSM